MSLGGRSGAAPALPFVDEGPRDPTFAAFRAGLLEIARRRDVAALLEVVHPDIRNTFGDSNGIEAFKRLWKLDRDGSELWSKLRQVLTLGGTFEGPDTFVAPYTFSRWPSEYDAFDYVALVGDAVRIRAAPRRDAPVLTTLSRSILPRSGTDHRDDWVGVLLPDGRSAFVSAELARSPVDYRAYFTRVDGRWRMITLIAGD